MSSTASLQTIKLAVMADINDPITHFQSWLSEAEKSEPNDPTAVALATADSNGMPNVRMVL